MAGSLGVYNNLAAVKAREREELLTQIENMKFAIK
jgi:hypothetical protein